MTRETDPSSCTLVCRSSARLAEKKPITHAGAKEEEKGEEKENDQKGEDSRQPSRLWSDALASITRRDETVTRDQDLWQANLFSADCRAE